MVVHEIKEFAMYGHVPTFRSALITKG